MIDYETRKQTYLNALLEYGEKAQLIVAIEELSEAQKEICKYLRGKGNIDHLAEEVADAQIMLEQVTEIFRIPELVSTMMDRKIRRLDDRLRDGAK